MQRVIQLLAVAAVASLGAAGPVPMQRRAISSSLLSELDLFSQYSAAAYCSSDYGAATGSKLTCSAGNCPRVQAADTQVLYDFNEGYSFGDATGYIAVDNTNQLIVLAFRGSSDFSNWMADLDTGMVDGSSLCSGCQVHAGFWGSWQTVASAVSSQINSAVAKYPGYTLVATGHSLGAALAGIAATVLRNEGHTVQLYDYGQPRLGNLALAEYITAETAGGNYRVTHTNDPVPKLPPMWMGYHHFSPEYWITSGNNVTVTTSDVQEIVGIDSLSGNAGTLTDDTTAHNWYIVDIDACS